MENTNTKYMPPFSLGNELTAEGFRLAQSNYTYRLASSRYYQFYSSYIRQIMQARFFNRAEIDIVAKMVHMSRRAVYYRIDAVINDLVFCLDLSR